MKKSKSKRKAKKRTAPKAINYQQKYILSLEARIKEKTATEKNLFKLLEKKTVPSKQVPLKITERVSAGVPGDMIEKAKRQERQIDNLIELAEKKLS